MHSIALLACKAGHEPVAKLVLEHRAGVNARSRLQLTAQREPCMEDYEGLAKLLLRHGADAGDLDSLGTNSLRTDSWRMNAP